MNKLDIVIDVIENLYAESSKNAGTAAAGYDEGYYSGESSAYAEVLHLLKRYRDTKYGVAVKVKKTEEALKEELSVKTYLYNITTDMADKLGVLKGYETAYKNPKEGKMVVNLNGINYFVEITAVPENVLDAPIEEAFREVEYRIK